MSDVYLEWKAIVGSTTRREFLQAKKHVDGYAKVELINIG